MQPKALVIDADREALGALESLLVAKGWIVVPMTQGLQSLRELQSMSPNLVVIGSVPDIATPEFAQRLRRVPRFTHVPILCIVDETADKAAFPAEATLVMRPNWPLTLPGALPALDSLAEPQKQIVMVIEDSPALRGLIKDILFRKGLDVLMAENFADARALITRQLGQAELVLLDINLPGGSGFELLAQIRERSSVPVFILSAVGRQEQIQRSQQYGVQGFIEKPFNPRELAQKVLEVLEPNAP